jgi:hypothetical protein
MVESNLIIPISVLGVGFVAAVSIGSIAWYNSKRPPGWESKERPDFVPKVDKDDLIADVSKTCALMKKLGHCPLPRRNFKGLIFNFLFEFYPQV